MNNDYFFLDNLYHLLEQGYGIEETLTICNSMSHHLAAESILEKVKAGMSLPEALKDDHLPRDFLEYYEFFALRFNLSDAIKNSLCICKHIKETKAKLRSQLTYPLILLTFLVMFSLFVTFVLFPQVHALFDSFAVETSLFFTAVFFLMKLLPIAFMLAAVGGIAGISYLIYALRHKKYLIIERYLAIPLLRKPLQTYFSLKFCLYFNELLSDHINANEIIVTLNQQMSDSDIKIMIYEIYTRIQEGESFEDIISHFEYFDPLFCEMYNMYLRSPDEIGNMQGYIDLTYTKIQMVLARFLKYFVPCVYGFVALFVISVYFSIIMPMMNIVGDI